MSISIAAHVTIWERPRLTELVLEHLVRVREQVRVDGISMPIVAIVSSWDRISVDDIIAMVSPGGWFDPRALARRYADHVIQGSFATLGVKNNAGGRAVYELGCDALMTVGSDDFISAAWVRSVAKALRRGAVAATLPGCAYLVPGRPLFWIRGSTNKGSDQWVRDHGALALVGAGRVYGRGMIERMKGELWPNSNTSGMDHGAYCITARGWMAGPVHVWGGSYPQALDVKTRGGITPPSRLALDAAIDLPDWWVRETFGAEVRDAIAELSEPEPEPGALSAQLPNERMGRAR